MSPTDRVRDPKMFWAFWGLVAASWQYRALKTHNGGTGSETTRAVLHTHTVWGKMAFILGYVAFTAWFPRHILKPLREAVISISGIEESNYAAE